MWKARQSGDCGQHAPSPCTGWQHLAGEGSTLCGICHHLWGTNIKSLYSFYVDSIFNEKSSQLCKFPTNINKVNISWFCHNNKSYILQSNTVLSLIENAANYITKPIQKQTSYSDRYLMINKK